MKRFLKIFLSVSLFAVIAVNLIGCSLLLSLEQKVCDHEYSEGVITKEATCLEKVHQ